MKIPSRYDLLALIASLCFIVAGVLIAQVYETPSTVNITLMAASIHNVIGRLW